MTDPNATSGRTGTTDPAGTEAGRTPSASTDATRVVPPVAPAAASQPSTPAAPSAGPRSPGERVEALTEQVTGHPAVDRLEQAMTGAAERLLPMGSSLREALSGSWLGQSLHPMLNDIPIGLWTSASVLDVISWRRSAAASRRLIGLGLLTALPTAASGLAELNKLDQRGRRAASVHAALNVTTLLLYLRSYGARRRRKHLRGALLALGAMTVATASGILGGQIANSMAEARTGANGRSRSAVDLDLTNGDVPPV